jgi:hypothetical protein
MAATGMTCEKFEEILIDYFEGDLPVESKAAADAHAKTCASCGAIVADINRITTEAAALPAMKPARSLWSGVEERISAPVIPLAQPAHRVRRFAFAPMAAAAAALIVTTAGITYLATRATVKQPTQIAVVTPTQKAPTVDSSAVPPTVASPSSQTSGVAQRVSTPSANLASNIAGNRRTPVTAVTAGPYGSPQEEAAYAKEIDVLERMVNSANSGLEPATVEIVKRNLEVIDDAIAQSKAALAKDPASPLLYDQVTRARGKKIELLRTMAALSSST